jgi:hypothetical protein
MKHNHAPSADCIDSLIEFVFCALPGLSEAEFHGLLGGILDIVGKEVQRVEKSMESFAALVAWEAVNHERAHVFEKLRKTVSVN